MASGRNETSNELRRRIPAVERILSSPAAAAVIAAYGRSEVKRAVVRELELIRTSEGAEVPEVDTLLASAADALRGEHALPLRRVLNATGVLIHTNLGRAPIAPSIVAEAAEMLSGYSNLEFDLSRGERGSRSEHLRGICQLLFGCEAALLVNNNAGGSMLAVAALAERREVIVSRGELVEIGGGFRVPEVIERGGAALREVGTTNRTRANDYADAVSEKSAAMLRVHRSNFEIVGFTEQPSVEELVRVARKANLPLIYDEGSGRVVDLSSYGLQKQETIAELISSGVDLVTCSTDKLIGATQGGLILGRADLVARCARHPLMRALRAGKESFGIIGATLQAFVAGRQEREIPLYRLLAVPLTVLSDRAAALAHELQGSVRETKAAVGGGTTPAETIPSFAIALRGSAERWLRALLDAPTPVVGRIENGEMLLDLRAIAQEEEEELVESVRAARAEMS